MPVFQISHTEIGVQRANAARGIQSWLGLRLDDRWSPVRIALVSHQLTDLQACSAPPAPPPPALGWSAVSCFWFACLRFLQRRNFHLSRNLGLSRGLASSGREIRLLFCHLPRPGEDDVDDDDDDDVY